MSEVIYLLESIKELALNRAKMAFISGPRQVGKTTISQEYAKKRYKFSGFPEPFSSGI